MGEAGRNTIRFLLGSELQEVTACDPQTTVLEWLRGPAGRRGTKEGCAEGDCGACTVTVVEERDGRLQYRAFNSCIQLLPMLDGKQLVTVEDLAGADPVAPQLHPVQQAMVDQHGSQCGFCTPGFVMSLFTLFHDPRAAGDAAALSRADIDSVLAGNLCRCTGYAPIVRATRQSLQELERGDRFRECEAATLQQLKQLADGQDLALEHEGRQFFAPRSLQSLWRLLDQFPDACLVAGATDVGLWITKQLQQFDVLVYLGEVSELKAVRLDAATGALEIGAAVTYADALPLLLDTYPELHSMLQRLGAEQVRNAGTLGGNIANGSPIGDMPPALIALDARLVLGSSKGRRELALADFFIEYGKQDLQAGECVEAVRIPPRPEGLRYAVYKLSRRFDQDISSLCAGFSLRVEKGLVVEPRISFGGMAGTPRRATAAEQALRGQPWSLERVQAAQQALVQDFEPLTDWRGSSDYRMHAAQNLVLRFYLETEGAIQAQLQRGLE